MKKLFVNYTEDYLSQQGDNLENIVFEMMARCIYNGTRIIIEQGRTYGEKYLMVDFAPTDGSNTNFITSDNTIVSITSVDQDDVDCEGDICEDFTNYMDACRWLSTWLREGNYGCAYIETY